MKPRNSLIATALDRGWITRVQAEANLDVRRAADLVDRGLLRPEQAATLAETPDDPAPPPPPERIGRHRIVGSLGQGGMGRVYKAIDEKLQRTVAVKTLHPGMSGEVLQRFLREARVMAALHHPGIVSVHDVGEADGLPYFVMDWIDGTSLQDALEEESLSRREAVEVVRQAAEAVAFAHGNGVLHRDLKPANILVNSAKRAVVTDFGLAGVAGEGESRLTVSGLALGTPSYLCPEQALGRWREVTERSDVWGLGATLYHVLTGTPPFGGMTVGHTLDQVVRQDPLRPSKVDPTIDRDAETICLKALMKEPSRRYASAGEFAEDLRRHLAGEPILARPPSAAYRIRRWAGRNRPWVAAGALTLLLGAASWPVATAWSRGETFRRSRAEARRASDAGEYERALAECDRALALRQDPELAALAARCRERVADEKARRTLRERLVPIETAVRDLGHFYYVRNVDIREKLPRVEAMLADLEVLLRDPRIAALPDGWRVLGAGRYFIGDARSAERTLLEAERRESGDAWALYYLARVYCERAMSELLTHERGLRSWRMGRAMDWSRRAAGYFREAASRMKAVPEMTRHIADTCQALTEGKEEEVLRRCEEGLSRFGREQGAEEYWILRGWVRHDEHRACYDRAIEIRPHHPWALLLRASVRPAGEREAAIGDCSEAVRIHPRLAEAYFVRGVLRHDRQDWDGAIADCTAALAIDPDLAHAHVNRAAARAAKGDHEGAIADATEAIRLQPGSAEAYASRGVSRVALGRTSEALEDFAAALRLDPAFADAFINRGLCRFRLNDLAGAQDDFEAAIRVEPGNAVAHHNLGYIKLLRHDAAAAEKHLTRAIELNPKYARAYLHRGGARLHLGKVEAALDDFSKAVELEPSDPEARGRRGEARLLSGDRTGAASDFEEALRLAPRDWPHRAATERMLREARSGN